MKHQVFMDCKCVSHASVVEISISKQGLYNMDGYYSRFVSHYKNIIFARPLWRIPQQLYPFGKPCATTMYITRSIYTGTIRIHHTEQKQHAHTCYRMSSPVWDVVGPWVDDP